MNALEAPRALSLDVLLSILLSADECRIGIPQGRRRQWVDTVEKGFYASERVRLIPNQAPARNVDSKIHFPRFDCCVFIFHSFSAVTFSTVSVQKRSR